MNNSFLPGLLQFLNSFNLFDIFAGSHVSDQPEDGRAQVDDRRWELSVNHSRETILLLLN